MKRTIIIIFILVWFSNLYSTEQVPDYLYYKNLKLTLSTGWGHPSPLQTYFSQNEIKYPFSELSTANYRGHIATWEIKDKKLFLKKIEIDKNNYRPSEFVYKNSNNNKKEIFSKWFSGVIECHLRSKDDYWDIEVSYFFHIKKGNVVEVQIIKKDELDKIVYLINHDSVISDNLHPKYNMLELNQNYISYYFRLHENDSIVTNNYNGYISEKSGNNLVLLYFSNDHMKWPFNWENRDSCGAPHGTWKISSNKLYLINLQLFKGTDLFSIDKEDLNLRVIFGNKVINNKVFADWISGIFIVKQGEQTENEILKGYYEFKVSKLTFLKIVKGKIEESYTISNKFDFNNYPDNIDPGLKSILKEIEGK